MSSTCSTIQSVEGLVAFVTGGGSGLGLATVQRLVREKAKGVVAFDLKFNDQQPKHDNVLYITGSVTHEDHVLKALEQCENKFGRLDVVVNCAGINLIDGQTHVSIYDFTNNRPHPLDGYRHLLEINAVGTFNVNRLAVGLIRKNQPTNPKNNLRGVLINVASIQAFEGHKSRSAYASSKGAVAAMTLPIARDLAEHGIRCVTIAPGFFDTPIVKGILTTYAKSIPCPQRAGVGDEFAHLVQSIIENPMINGEIIRIDAALRLAYQI